MMKTDTKVQLNFVDRTIAFFSPVAGARRLAARSVLSHYDAAKPSRLRKGRKANGSPNAGSQMGAVGLRGLARHLEANHDIARGALRTLVNNVVGPSGIGIEPQPRRRDGSIHVEYSAALRTAYRNWAQTPEVTQRHHWSKVQRLVAKTWLRDGECFSQRLIGAVPLLDHGTKVPYSLELIESDLIPFDYHDLARSIQQKIERNTWGKPTGYWAYKAFPGGDSWTKGSYELKRIDAALRTPGGNAGGRNAGRADRRCSDLGDLDRRHRSRSGPVMRGGYVNVRLTSRWPFNAISLAVGVLSGSRQFNHAIAITGDRAYEASMAVEETLATGRACQKWGQGAWLRSLTTWGREFLCDSCRVVIFRLP